ncbi:MAG: hypothetical protein DCC71_20070 [Proteobacteria bacterium]|nr:MAG: hypothetical protein DCC71_20070 [Pseudomonadota bacterium]
MSRFQQSAAALAGAAALFVATGASALTIDYAALSDQSSGAIVQVAGPVTVTAQAFGGVSNPQGSMTPSGTPGGFTALSVNVGGSAFLGTRGLGCGPVASQCDLIAPIGEDVLRLSFSQPVVIDSLTIAAMEDPDDVRWYAWNGASYALAGSDTCTTFSFCGGNETFAGPFGAPTGSSSWILVAENSGASAFALRAVSFTPIPEPGTALLIALGLAVTAGRARRS